MRSTSIWGVKSLDPWDQVHIFSGSRVLPPQNFLAWGTQGHKFFPQKDSLLFSSAHANCRNLRHACMGGGAAPPGRYFPDGTWSCIPEHAVRSVNFIAEQQYSAPFPTHRMLLGAASSKFAHSFAFVQVAYQHFTSLNNSSCPRLHAAYRIRVT